MRNSTKRNIFKILKSYRKNIDSSVLSSEIITAQALGALVNVTFGIRTGITGLIETAPLIFESIYRNEACSEIDLHATEVETDGTYNYLYFDGSEHAVKSSVDDFYNGAYLCNITQDYLAEILDFTGSEKKIKIDDSYSVASTDLYKIVNINAKLITDSIDELGNSIDGLRKDWKFAKSLNKLETFGNIIEPLFYESFIGIDKRFDSYRLFPIIEDVDIVGTFSNPMISEIPMIALATTHLANVYTDFEIRYAYEYGREEYAKKIQVKNNYATDINGIDYTTEKGLIQNAITNYKKQQSFAYDCQWINDNNTDSYFTKKLINLLTKQRTVVEFTGNVKSYEKYEIGDTVKINNNYLPTNLNNSTKFQIFAKTTDMTKGQPFVTFNLIEV